MVGGRDSWVSCGRTKGRRIRLQSGHVGERDRDPEELTLGFLQVRDDNKRLHPCLVDFHSLPEPERNYNLQMSGETLK